MAIPIIYNSLIYNIDKSTIDTSNCVKISYYQKEKALIELLLTQPNDNKKEFIKGKTYIPLINSTKNEFTYEITREYDTIGSVRIVDNIYEGDVDSITLYASFSLRQSDQRMLIPIITINKPSPKKYIRFFQNDFSLRKFPFTKFYISIKFSDNHRYTNKWPGDVFLEIETTITDPDNFYFNPENSIPGILWDEKYFREQWDLLLSDVNNMKYKDTSSATIGKDTSSATIGKDTIYITDTY